MKTKNNEIEYVKNVKELLITIDMVNGFIKEGTLAAPNIKRIIPKQVERIKEALASMDKGIVFIKDAHTEKSTEFKTYPKHCIKGSSESELVDELKDFEKDALVYLKNSTNLGMSHQPLTSNGQDVLDDNNDVDKTSTDNNPLNSSFA